MGISSFRLKRQIAGCLVMLLAAPLAEAAAPSQQAPGGQKTQSASSAQKQSPESSSQAGKTDADTSRTEASLPESPEPVRSQAGNLAAPTNTAQAASEPQQGGVQQPVGTAAAPYEKTTGIAASRPAGAVIAPEKQRRARSILIRVSLVVGAAVAVGTVAVLSRGSSSRPN